MKKLLVLAAIMSAMSCSFASAATNTKSVYAEGSTSEGDPSGWVWRVLIHDDITPGEAGSKYANMNFLNEHYYYSMNNDGFDGVIRPNPLPNGWTGDGPGWISIPNGNPTGFGDNGFYAYRTTFTSTVSGVVNDFRFNGNFWSDDQIVAVFINGVQLDITSSPEGALSDPKYNGWANNVTNYNANSIIGDVAIMLDSKEVNYVDIILRNDHTAGGLQTNATGLNGDWFFDVSNVEIVETTPEPATLAMLGLALCGLPFARRFRRK
ncbi:MAG: PEP-CTERM sorting domain-containing protein [Thermoguttaceae bacterium]